VLVVRINDQLLTVGRLSGASELSIACALRKSYLSRKPDKMRGGEGLLKLANGMAVFGGYFRALLVA
jgi:hypothetical protein